jgi:hypothetical protein
VGSVPLLRVSLVLVLGLGCNGGSTLDSANVTIQVDACAPSEASVAQVPCSSDDDCVAAYKSRSPSGTLHVVCFQGTNTSTLTNGCQMAEVCGTDETIPNYCRCGVSDTCGSELCVTPPGQTTAACVSACGQ